MCVCVYVCVCVCRCVCVSVCVSVCACACVSLCVLECVCVSCGIRWSLGRGIPALCHTAPVKTNFTNVEICVCIYVASCARVIHDLLICDRLCARVTYFGVYVITLRLAYICAITYCFSLAVCVRPVICAHVTNLVPM